MKNIKPHNIFFLCFIATVFVSSCSSNSDNKSLNIDYTFQTAKNVTHSINDFNKVVFNDDNNLDLGFYKGQVWIKLVVKNSKNPKSLIVLCNDLINHNYRFYRLNKKNNTFLPCQNVLNLDKYDHRSFIFAKPNFKIDLESNEESTFLITTSSDGRILQATPKLISIDEFYSIKQQHLLFDIIYYTLITIILIINLVYFSMVKSKIYYFYGFYIISGCIMYLFVEGKLYGVGLTHQVFDHLMFISIRLWVISGILFTLNFLKTKSTNPIFYKFIILLLFISTGAITMFQLIFFENSISNLHQTENLIGFIWVILSLLILAFAYKKQRLESNYYLIAYAVFLVFVTFGLIDSHATILPGDPFSYFKVGSILEFIGFTYFIAILVKQRLLLNEKLQLELNEKGNMLKENELVLASNISLVSVFKLIENSLTNDTAWNEFQERFTSLNPNFVKSISENHPDLTKSEIRLLILFKIGYSQKEIADILNIAPDSVKKARTRLRKKLNLDDSDNLISYLSSSI